MFGQAPYLAVVRWLHEYIGACIKAYARSLQHEAKCLHSAMPHTTTSTLALRMPSTMPAGTRNTSMH